MILIGLTLRDFDVGISSSLLLLFFAIFCFVDGEWCGGLNDTDSGKAEDQCGVRLGVVLINFTWEWFLPLYS